MTVKAIYYDGVTNIWESDGTVAGTQILLPSTLLSPNPNFITFGQYVVFGVPETGYDGIYITDGTAAGTVMLAPFDKFHDSIQSQTVIGTLDLIKTFSDEIWATDGTPTGTQKLTFTTVPPTFSWIVYSGLYSLGATAVFAATTVHSNYISPVDELWVSDGTSGGTMPLTVAGEAISGLTPTLITPFGQKAAFLGYDSSHNQAIWITDGTNAGTFELDAPGIQTSPIVTSMIAIGSLLLFGASDSAGNNDLWVTDGTIAGTMKLPVALPNASASSFNGNGLEPDLVVAFGNKALFLGLDAASNIGLWVTDGTVAGTTELSTPGLAFGTSIYFSTTPANPSNFFVHENQVYFVATDSVGRTGLWITDGTSAGTQEITPANANFQGIFTDSVTPQFVSAGNVVLFQGNDLNGNRTLWETDGTSAGTHEIDLVSGKTTVSPFVASGASTGLPVVAPGQVTVAGAAGDLVSVQFAGAASAAPIIAAFAAVNAGVNSGSIVPFTATAGATIPNVAAGLTGVLLTHTGGVFAMPAGYAAFATDSSAPLTVSGGATNGQVVLAGFGGLALNAGAGSGSVFAAGGNNLISAYPGAGSQYIQPGNGNNTIVALSGNETLVGGTGTSEILTGAGNDQIGTNGTDLIAAGAIGASTITAGANNPTAFFGPGTTVFDAGSGKATVVGTTGADTVNAQGGTQIWLGTDSDVVNTIGADTIIGSTGAGTVNASGNSFLFAGAGNMRFVDTGGSQTIHGAGNGSLDIQGGNGSVIALSYGDTNFTGGAGAATIAGFGGSLTVTAGSGSGVYLGGPAGGNSITGGSGQSIILGTAAGDVLTAGTGAGDVLEAGAGAETISASGSDGSEKLYGGTGPDLITTGLGSANVLLGTGAATLIAGGGLDNYAFTSGNASSVDIQNFNAIDDYLSLVGFNASAGASALAGATTIAGSEHLTLSDGTAITLQGFTGLTAANFL